MPAICADIDVTLIAKLLEKALLLCGDYQSTFFVGCLMCVLSINTDTTHITTTPISVMFSLLNYKCIL